MYKSFEEELQDNRSRLQKKIRKQDIKRRIAAIRHERLASQQMRVHQMNALIDELPQSLQKITVQLIEKENYWLKGLLIDRINRLNQCLELANGVIDWKNVCFVLTDLMISLPEKVHIVISNTFKIVLSRALEEISSSLIHKHPSQTSVVEYFLVALESCSPKDMPDEDFESLCQLIHKQLSYFDNNYQQIQSVVQLIQTILSRDCQPNQLSTKLSRKQIFIQICFAKEPNLVNKLFLLCLERSDSTEDDSDRLFITILQMFVNLTYYMAPNQQSCIQIHQIFCLLQISLKEQSLQTVHLGIKLFYNSLYFRKKYLPYQASQFGIINKLLQLLKQSDQIQQGFEFIMDVVEALSKYILIIDPQQQCQLMGSFVGMDGLQAMLYSLNHMDLHKYQPETIVMCLHAIRKIVCFLTTVQYTEQWRVLVMYEPYLEKLTMLDNSKIAEAAEQILQIIKQHLERRIELEFN